MLNLIQTAFAQTDKAQQVTSETTSQLANFIGVIISKIPLWITAFIVIVISFFLAKIIKSSVENRLTAEGLDEEHQGIVILAGRTANATVLTIGITAGLKIAGIDLTSIIAAGAFGVGFALKDIIMNFLAGVLLLASKHYSIGDIIKVGDIMGKIVEIQTRATIIKNFDGTQVLVPNSTLFKNAVTNYTSNPFRRVSVEVGVEYGTDLKKAMEACLKAVKESKGILIDPKPSVAVTGFGDSSINLKVNGWVESSKGIKKPKTEMIINIAKEFKSANIGIPFPITTIMFDNEKQTPTEEEQLNILAEESTNSQPEQSPQELKPQPQQNTTTSQPPTQEPQSTQTKPANPQQQTQNPQPTTNTQPQPTIQLPQSGTTETQSLNTDENQEE